MKINHFPKPDAGVIELTTRCNLGSMHCHAKSTLESDADMPFTAIKKILPEIKKIGATRIAVLGGEVLLRKDIAEIIIMIKKAGFKMDSLVTNGVLLNRKMLSTLNNLGVTNLTIRIDSAKSSAMDALRGKGAFKRIIYNAGQAIKMGFKVFFSTTVCKLNFREIDKIIGLAKKINAVNLSLNHIFYHGRSICYADILKLSPEEERETLFKINELNHDFGSYITGDYVRQIDFIKILEKDMLGKKYICIDTCGAGNRQIFIRSDGWVAPCPAMRNIKLGNINERSLTEIWRDADRMIFFRRPFCLDLIKFHDCKSCIYQKLCYTRHRCYPYFLPTGFSDKSFYCIVPGGSTEPIFKF